MAGSGISGVEPLGSATKAWDANPAGARSSRSCVLPPPLFSVHQSRLLTSYRFLRICDISDINPFCVCSGSVALDRRGESLEGAPVVGVGNVKLLG
jgi:hypothetical protein